MAPTPTTVTTELLQLSPSVLILDSNVRKQVTLDEQFMHSLKTFGVIIPVLVHPPVKGKYTVFDGQRRVLAAADLKLSTVPAIVVDAQASDVERIYRQLTVNDDRAEISTADTVQAFLDLELAGVPADEIATKTHVDQVTLNTALEVAKAPAATAVMRTHQLTLAEASIFAELGNNPEDLAKLTTKLEQQRSGLNHTAAAIRDDHAEKEATAIASAAIADAGVTEIPRQQYNDNALTVRVESLYANPTAKTTLTAAKHKNCPGHAAVAHPRRTWGETPGYIPEFFYVCTDWKANGHHSRYSSSGSSSGPLSDEEKAKRKLARENTKKWVPATDVRIAFVKDLLQRKDMPTGWITMVARYIVANNTGDYRSRDLTAKLLDTNLGLTDWLAKNPTRHANLALAAAISDIEAIYEYGKKGWQQHVSIAYLRQLSKWGYPLSEIEESVVAETAKEATK